MKTGSRESLLAILVVVAVVSVTIPGRRGRAEGAGSLVGKWVDSSDEDGLKETLVLYSNGAYREETAIADSKEYRANIERNCRERRARTRERCDQKSIDDSISVTAKYMPEVFIGTYVTDAARIAFTHSCAEGIRDCKAGSVREGGIYFVDGDSLTIKYDGAKYKGRIIGGAAQIFRRQ
jgi:hypothetical protein